MGISTHSLTRRLTLLLRRLWTKQRISTHSLTRRLTSIILLIDNNTCYFNSQPHKEADIHKDQEKHSKKYFNSQPHKEADASEALKRISSRAFQLTASQGG